MSNEMLRTAIKCRQNNGEFEVEIHYGGIVLLTTYTLENIDIYDDYFVIWGNKYDLTIYPKEFQYYDGAWHSLCETITFS